MAEIIFWVSLSLILYAYFGYPALLYLVSAVKSNSIQKGPVQPRITIIIAAHNEERSIGGKIENTLCLDYRPEQREIIVASDGSTDRTNEIVLGYKDKGIILVAPLERKGKEHAQWQAIDVATGDILVFSDVATTLEKDALIHIASNFHDPTIGCVSSEDKILVDPKTSGGEGFYVKYEMLLRRLESKVNSVVGLSGSFFAVRRNLCREWSTILPSDFLLVIRAVKNGYRAVIDPLTVGSYKSVRSEKEEFQRKRRTVMRGIAVLMNHPEILNPFKYGFFSIQLISHKLLRWLVPLFAVCVFVSNVCLIAESPAYQVLFAGQMVFYVLAVLGLLVKPLNRNVLVKVPAFLTLVNLSITVAWIKYLFGHRAIRWEPSRR
jgi:cellulose synthase/poly-beta-1,6-N-acetylglucosamine synthase-like glycosyltransferase